MRRSLVLLAAAVAVSAGCLAPVQDTVRQAFGDATDLLGAGPSNRWARAMIQASQLHDRGLTGDGVTVAVVDTGVRATHPEFRGVPVGWADLVNGRKKPYDNNGHGTHVSGLAVAQPDPGAPDVAGAAPGAALLHLKAVGQDGSAEGDDVEEAVRAATREGADVLVLSLGERGRVVEVSRGLEDAVRDAIEKGVVVVAAAGNAPEGESGENCSIPSPADLRRVIAVGAVDRNRNIARFSCSGPDGGPAGLRENEDPHKKPELSAPGVKVAGPWPERACAGRAEARYCFLSGTSQATPLVGGAVAAILEERPDLQRKDAGAVVRIKRALAETAEKAGFSGHHDRYGYGIVQAADALRWLETHEGQDGDSAPLTPGSPGAGS